MAKPRQRYTDDDKPRHCDVRVPPALAVYLYRERLERKYRDETELVMHIVRMWAESLDPVDWKDLLKRLKEEEQGGAGAGAKAG